MPEAELPRHSQAQRTADAIVAAATPLFAADPLERVSAEQLARAAGVAVGSIHAHFGSRERLYLEVVRRALEVCDRYTVGRIWSSSPVRRLRATGDAFVEFALAHPHEFRIVGERAGQTTGIAAYSEFEAENSALLRKPMIGLAADAQAAMDAGEIRVMPVQQVVALFWAMWSGVITMTARADAFQMPVEFVRPMLRDAADVLARGLAPDPVVGRPAASDESVRAA